MSTFKWLIEASLIARSYFRTEHTQKYINGLEKN